MGKAPTYIGPTEPPAWFIPLDDVDYIDASTCKVYLYDETGGGWRKWHTIISRKASKTFSELPSFYLKFITIMEIMRSSDD